MSDGAVVMETPPPTVVVKTPGIQGPPGPSGAVTGMVFLWAASAIPPGFLLCDGSAISRVAYPSLFAAIGILWGAGDGSTTFNLPDLRDRVAIGASPGSLTSRPTARTIASNGGEESHTLTISEMPAHSHVYEETVVGSYAAVGTSQSGSVVGSWAQVDQPTSNAGTGGAHNNMQPFAVLNYLIKS